MPRMIGLGVIFREMLDGNPYDFDRHQDDFVDRDHGISFRKYDVSVVKIESMAMIDCQRNINEIAQD